MNFNDYYNYINERDMNFITKPNDLMQDLNYQNNMQGNSKNQNSNLVSAEEGFKRGNLFKNLYDEYKNYKPRKLVANSEREDLLMQIEENNFAMIELQLYLDIYPNDSNALSLFNKYLNMKKDLVNIYEEKYGPLTIDSDVQKRSWLWIKSPWPWEVQK